DEVHAHRSRIAEIARLDRRRPKGQNLGPRILRVALKVDDDVDLEVADELGNLAIALRAHIVQPIEGLDQAAADIAAVVAIEGNPQDLEMRAVVQLDELRD